jgi:hypothetical protein
MGTRRWLGSLGALILGALAAFLQVLINPILSPGFPRGFPPILPNPHHQRILCLLAFLFAMMASYRPRPMAKAISLWLCGGRALLWGILVGGSCYQAHCMMARFTTRDPRPQADPDASIVVFGIVWFIAFHAFASDALQLRGDLEAGEL